MPPRPAGPGARRKRWPLPTGPRPVYDLSSCSPLALLRGTYSRAHPLVSVSYPKDALSSAFVTSPPEGESLPPPTRDCVVPHAEADGFAGAWQPLVATG